MEEDKYKDVLKGIVEIIRNAEHSDIGFASICTYIGDHCPELENKDEDIRKKLIEYFKGLMGGWFPYSNEEIIAYLEKVKDFDKQLEDAYKTADEVQYKRGYGKGYVDGMVAAKKKELEKQGKPEDMGEVSDGYHTFNELYYYRMLYNAAFFNRLPKDWVHKSKRHHTGEECFGGGWFVVMANLPTGQISNHYELKDWDLFQIPEKDIADEWDGHTPQQAAERLYKYLLEKQGEQSPADKVEPKFKVGDWIAHNTTNTTYCIDDISDGRYYITRSNGDKTYNSIKMVEDHAHLWSIKDAKPGDILASSRSIFIFKGIYMADKPEAYCGVWNDFFIETYEGCWTNERCYPATKEQQRLLFEKITEAGYEWKEKVLNKIEMQDLVTSKNNVTKISDQDKWDDEDIRMLNTVINIFEKVYPSNYFTTFVTGSENPTLINSPEIVKWLKGIKEKLLSKLNNRLIN